MIKIPDLRTYDVVVIGAGAGGLAAATFAALEGAKVLLIESTGFVGGTTAYSAGSTWVPNTRLSDQVGGEDSPEKALRFLDNAVGNNAPRALRQAFIEKGPEAIHTLMDKAGMRFKARPFHPDYLYEIEGSTKCGRVIEAEPFDASVLGKDLALIRPTIPEFTILGGLMVDRVDIGHLLGMKSSLKSLVYSLKLIANYGLDRLKFGRSARLVMGSALVGRLLLAARQSGVELRTDTKVAGLALDKGGTCVTLEGGETLLATGGVILATGGFGQHPTRRQEMMPSPVPEHSPAAPGHTGALQDMALKLGAYFSDGGPTNMFWAPVSKCQRADGSWAVFPHFVFDRSKPGIIAVGADGKRFTNESRSYHEFAQAQYATQTIPAYLLTDAKGLKKYGLGMVRPGGMGAAKLLRNGYLVQAASLAELAGKLSIDPVGLQETVERMKRFAESGKDADFNRGETVYERANGDAEHGPNPTLGTLSEAPFYGIRLWPADIGCSAGLVTDETSRLQNRDGSAIPGLYACGNDMQSIMGGIYPGPGINIGPAIAFAFTAARDAVARSRAES